MKEQSASKHSRYVPFFHFVTPLGLLALLIMAIMRLCCTCSGPQCSAMLCMHEGMFELLITLVLIPIWWHERRFAVRNQDRIIYNEENFRHFVLTGKPLDLRLTRGQVIALRFASDDEYLALLDRAIKENLKPGDIKKAIKNWKPDHNRV